MKKQRIAVMIIALLLVIIMVDTMVAGYVM